MDKLERIPDNVVQPTQMHVLFHVGFTARNQVCIYWPPGPWKDNICNLSSAMKQEVVDAIKSAVIDSIDKQIPRIITIS